MSVIIFCPFKLFLPILVRVGRRFAIEHLGNLSVFQLSLRSLPSSTGNFRFPTPSQFDSPHMVRVGRIELPSFDWQPNVLPLNHTRYTNLLGNSNINILFLQKMDSFLTGTVPQLDFSYAYGL